MLTTSDRSAAMTAELPQPISVGELHRYAPDAQGRRRLSFQAEVGGQRLAEVAIIPTTSEVPQVQFDAFAGALHSLLKGSEDRVADAQGKVFAMREAVNGYRSEIGKLQNQLAAFEKGPAVRGECYAVEGAGGCVWLVGRPSGAAFGFWFKNWAELARELAHLLGHHLEAGHPRRARSRHHPRVGRVELHAQALAREVADLVADRRHPAEVTARGRRLHGPRECSGRATAGPGQPGQTTAAAPRRARALPRRRCQSWRGRRGYRPSCLATITFMISLVPA